MSEKSELEYLLDALKGEVHPRWLNLAIRRAIERRKQDLAKADAALLYTNREKLYMDTPQNVPNTADNTPKGGGDVPEERKNGPFTLNEWNQLRIQLDNALAECENLRSLVIANDIFQYRQQLDAARADLKEAVQLLRTVNSSYWQSPEGQSPEGDPALLNAIENIGPFLTRVGKQPKVGP